MAFPLGATDKLQSISLLLALPCRHGASFLVPCGRSGRAPSSPRCQQLVACFASRRIERGFFRGRPTTTETPMNQPPVSEWRSAGTRCATGYADIADRVAERISGCDTQRLGDASRAFQARPEWRRRGFSQRIGRSRPTLQNVSVLLHWPAVARICSVEFPP